MMNDKNEYSTSRPHRTVMVEVNAIREEIDVALAPLIREVWLAGIETMMSCQETEPGIAWIEFMSVDDLLRFLNLVTKFEPGIDTLYNRIQYLEVGPMSAPVWAYQPNLMDILEDQEEQDIDGSMRFEATASAYFPQSDIPLLLQRLQEHNTRF